MQRTPEQMQKIIDWLSTRVTYLEHASTKGDEARSMRVGHYWPQSDADGCPDPDCIDLNLIDYIEQQIANPTTTQKYPG